MVLDLRLKTQTCGSKYVQVEKDQQRRKTKTDTTCSSVQSILVQSTSSLHVDNFRLRSTNYESTIAHLPLKCQECQVSKYKKYPSTHVPKCQSTQLPMYRVTNYQHPFDQQRPTNHERQITYHQLRTTNYAFQLHVSLHLLTLKFTYPYFCLPLNLFTFAFINAYISQV